MNIARIFRHLTTGQAAVKRAFPAATLIAIEQAIAQSETTHSGEIVFAVEAALDMSLLLHNQSVRERAIDVFSLLRVWDTEQNNGILIYLLLADHNVEIVADRGIHSQVKQTVWESACDSMEDAFRREQFEAGILAGIHAVTLPLQQFFPPKTISKTSGLPDKPVIL